LSELRHCNECQHRQQTIFNQCKTRHSRPHRLCGRITSHDYGSSTWERR
jgi:hypothetical protein